MGLSRERGDHRLTFAVLAAGVAAYALLQSLVVPVLTTVQEQLHTSQDTATWVLTAYLLSASVMTPILGRVGDMIGKERVFVASLLALGVGSALAAVAPSIGVMIAARVIQGFGGGVLPVAFGIVRDEFPEPRVAGAVGSLASLTAVGGGLGIVLAGPIVTALSWRWLFWLPMIVTVLAAAGAVLFVPESPVRSPGRISLLPAVLLSAWLVALLVALSEAPVWGWGSARVLGLLAVAVVACVLWIWSELRAVTPLIDMAMMRLPAVWTNNLVALLIGVGMYATFAFLPEMVQTPRSAGYGFGASITQSGLMLLPWSVLMFGTGQFTGRLLLRFGGKALVVSGSLIGAASLAMLAFAHSAVWEIYLADSLMGIGFGLAFPAMAALIVDAVPASQTGVASGMNANVRTIGGSIGSALMASIVTARLLPSGLPQEAGYTGGFAAMTAALLLAAAAGLLIPVARRVLAAAGPGGCRSRRRGCGCVPVPGRGGGRDGVAGRRDPGQSGRVALGALHVDPAGRCLPLVPAGARLGDGPAGRLLDLVTRSAAGSGVTAAGPAALVERNGMLEVRLARVPGARREGAGAVTDLNQVTEPVVGLVRMRLVPVITVERGHRLEFHGEIPAVGQGQCPGAMSAGRSGVTGPGKGPRLPARRADPARWACGGGWSGQLR